MMRRRNTSANSTVYCGWVAAGGGALSVLLPEPDAHLKSAALQTWPLYSYS
jgi:hypothetical protein